MKIICKHAIVSGVVQGVGFRASAVHQAAKIGDLQGWARNLVDGSVEIVVQGPANKVDKLLEWCRRGPSTARVDDVVEEAYPVDPSFTSFRVKY